MDGQGGPFTCQALKVSMLAWRSLTSWKVIRPTAEVITTTALTTCTMPKPRLPFRSRGSRGGLVGIAELARLFRKHDRHAVAYRIGQARAAADQLGLVAIILQRSVGH